MRKIALAVSILLAISTTAVAGSRTITHSLAAGGLDGIELNSGIGDVKITGSTETGDVMVEVILTPRRGGLFSSKRKAERDVEAASLKADVKGTRLILGIYPPLDDEERRFEEHWTVVVPASLSVELEHGVGDVDVQGVGSGVEIESGVGDVRVAVAEGSVTLDLGVGNAAVRAPAEIVAFAEGAGGVGEARLTVRGQQIESTGFVGHTAKWKGTGSHRIEVSVGVGDAVITLE
jgi:hypothetical protein